MTLCSLSDGRELSSSQVSSIFIIPGKEEQRRKQRPPSHCMVNPTVSQNLQSSVDEASQRVSCTTSRRHAQTQLVARTSVIRPSIFPFVQSKQSARRVVIWKRWSIDSRLLLVPKSKGLASDSVKWWFIYKKACCLSLDARQA